MSNTTDKGTVLDFTVGQNGWGASVNDDLHRFDAWARTDWAFDPIASSALGYHYFGGTIFATGAYSRVADGSVILGDNMVNYVERTVPGVVSRNGTGFTTTSIPMAKVTTSGGLITVLEDWRGVDLATAIGASPTGAAAGDLAGTYPNPTIKADVALSGNPTTTTQSAGNNTTRIATTAFVSAAITALINAAPGTLDTLEELADALGDDANFAATMTTALAGKISNTLLTTLGDIIYASAANTPARLAGNTTTTRKWLRSTGAAGVATAPAYDVIVENDVGASTNDAGNTSTAITVDWSLGRTQKVTATGNFTLTHSNMVAGLVYTLEVYTGAGSFTGAFASTNFASGTAPTLTVTASKVDVFTFYKTIGGTIFGGIFGQSFVP